MRRVISVGVTPAASSCQRATDPCCLSPSLPTSRFTRRDRFSLPIWQSTPVWARAPPALTSLVAMSERRPEALRAAVPGTLYPWVKRASWVELGMFAALVLFWLMPGFESQTMVFGWAHGLGFVALAILIWIAVLRHEAPYTLLAATLTPVGPLGSVIAISWMERREPGR